MNPALSIFVLTSLNALFICLFNRHNGNSQNIKKLKEKSHEYRVMLREAMKEKDQPKYETLSKEFVKINGKIFNFSLRPILLSIIMFTALGLFLRTFYNTEIIIFPFLNVNMGWFWMYLLANACMMMFFRRILDV
jgi:uncharacterized membrane protein (DUF106 family)